MLGDKSERFQGKNTDLGKLQAHIEKYLTDDGFKVQSSVAGDKGTVIQAKKESFLRDLVDADRAFTITITGDPSDFTVRFGVGKWVQHLGVAALEALLVAEIFLIVDIADSAWSLEVEDKIITDMKGFIG
jgi:hypothetical protein